MVAKAASLVRSLAAFVVCSVSFSGFAQTFEEIKEMAEQGDAVAQNKLGKLYDSHEHGVRADDAKALSRVRFPPTPPI